MRDFVMQHPDYKHDSIVSQSVAHDLIQAIINYNDVQTSQFVVNGDGKAAASKDWVTHDLADVLNPKAKMQTSTLHYSPY